MEYYVGLDVSLKQTSICGSESTTPSRTTRGIEQYIGVLIVDKEIAVARDDCSRNAVPVSRRIRVRTQLIHQVMAAAKRIADRKMSARLSYRVAIRRKSLSRQNIRSMTLRPLYAALS
jgi:hypothetical protein